MGHRRHFYSTWDSVVLKNLECIHKGYLFVKLDFEITVDQQTMTGDPTFEGVPDSDRPPVPTGQPRPYLVPIWPNFGKSPKYGQNPDFMCFTCSWWSPELVYQFSSRLDKKWLSYEPKTICPYLGTRTKFDRFWIINWSNINISEWD